MSHAQMLALARAGCTDPDARVVLVDMIRETGWWDTRIRYALSNGDDREECLALITWPGETGEHHARLIVQALESSPAEPGTKTCAFCLGPAEGEYSIHRDGWGKGPEVDLCDEHGAKLEPTCAKIWARIAVPSCPLPSKKDA